MDKPKLPSRTKRAIGWDHYELIPHIEELKKLAEHENVSLDMAIELFKVYQLKRIEESLDALEIPQNDLCSPSKYPL